MPEMFVDIWTDLPEEEFKEKSIALAELNCYIDELKEKKKALADSINPCIKESEESIHELSRELKAGKKLQKIEVDYKKDLDEKVMVCTRKDTGELLPTLERPLTQDEMQEELEL